LEANKIHPELRKKYSRMPNPVITNRFKLWLMRKMVNFMTVIIDKSDRQVTISKYKLRHCSIRVFKPSGSLSGAGLLWIHGGGLISMTAKSSDNDCRQYAKRHRMIVVSVDYRLAPEHPFPAAPNDCFDAWQWLLANAEELGVDTARIAVGGQSAGGGLAAGLCQRILDQSPIQPAAQYLIYPMLDDDTAAKTELDSIGHRLWSNKNNRFGWDCFLGTGNDRAGFQDYAVPSKRADLSGLPAAWIGVGNIDLFYEENRVYAEKLEKCGVPCELYVVDGAPHAFEILVPDAPVAIDFMKSANAFLADRLGQ